MSGSIGDETTRAANVVAQEFWKDYKPDGNGGMKEVHMVRWSRRGDLHYHASNDDVARIKRPIRTEDGQEIVTPLWMAIRPAYEAWLAGIEAPVDGTPLDAWPALNKAGVKAFRDAGYKSVEDIEAMIDSDIQRVRFPGVRKIRDLARAYVANKAGSAHIEEAMAKRDDEIQKLKDLIGDLQSALQAKAEAPAQVDAG